MDELSKKLIDYSELAKNELVFESERDLYSEVKQRVDSFGKLATLNIIAIAGLRGTGKTTILKSLVKKYNNSLYLAGDFLQSNKMSFEDIMQVSRQFGKDIVLIDEIHYLENWGINLKITADLYQKTMFIITGSSSLLMKEQGSELKRRAIFYTLYPLSFREFLRLKYNLIIDKQDLLQIIFNEPKLDNKYAKLLKYYLSLPKGMYEKFQEYQIRQFPITVNETIPYLITKDLINRVIEKDIPLITNITGKILLRVSSILEYLALSDKVSLTKISAVTGINYDTVEKILESLERADVLRNLEPYNATNTLKNIKRYIFTAPSVRVAYGFYNDKRALGYAREDLFATIVKSQDLEPKYILEEKQYDFMVNNLLFEIGAKSKKIKTRGQVIVITDGQSLKLNNNALYIPFEMFALLQ